MGISVEDIRKKVAERRGHDAIDIATYHQNRIKFHAQKLIQQSVYYQPTADFFAFVKNILPHDKYKLFVELFRYPVDTNEICEVCFDKLSRIFDGRNPSYNYQFLTSDDRDDWEWYRQDRLREPQVWQTKGWEHFKTEINSVLVVDLPEEQRGDKPEPYFYWLNIYDVLAFKAHRNGMMDWIAFRQDDGKVAVIDDEFYRIFRRSKVGEVGELLVEKPHLLGYTPARFFWSEPLSLSMPDVKASPLTKELSRLDWWLFYHISKKHLDLFGSYPIYSGYEQTCDFENTETGDYCDGGYLKDIHGHYLFDRAGALLPCPKCGSKRIVGAGSFVEIPVPVDGQPDMKNPVQMLSVDRSSLDYNVSEEKRLRDEIITAVCGQAEEITQRDAFNEQQIKAGFESQTTVLSRVKKNFEQAQQFVDETVCRLRYADGFLAASVNYGTEFYLYDVAELRDRYAKARENGASEAELDALQNQIIETEYRHNPLMMQRMMTLQELEPYRHMSRDEVVTLADKGIIDRTDMLVKLNFASLVRRFERENINVTEFGTDIPFDRKIEVITNTLRNYVSEDRERDAGRSND